MPKNALIEKNHKKIGDAQGKIWPHNTQFWDTGVWPGISGLPFLMGNQFSTDYLGTVVPILMILLADPHEISIPIQC